MNPDRSAPTEHPEHSEQSRHPENARHPEHGRHPGGSEHARHPDIPEPPHAVLHSRERLEDLLSATRAIAEDLDLEVVLRRIIQAAVNLVGARYGALGVIGPDGMLEQFIHVGIDGERGRAIGHLPTGLGILGALTADNRPVRLEHLSADPRSVGFPAHHPPMDSFLGVPVQVRGEVFGNLYLTDRVGGPFSAEDEELLRSLAAAAGVAISNARLFGDTQRRQRWTLASAEVASALLDADGADPLGLIATSVIRLTDAAVVALIVRTGSGAFATDGAWGDDADAYLGRVFSADATPAAHVISSGNPVLSAGLPHPSRAAEATGSGEAGASGAAGASGTSGAAGEAGASTGSSMTVPLTRAGGADAALLVARPAGAPRFDDLDLDMITDFAAQASVALELRSARAARERVALLEDRGRIARDLHDNVIQRLFGAGLALNGMDLDALPAAARTRIDGVSDLLDEAVAEIRTSVFSLRSAQRAKPAARHRLLDVVSEVAGAFPTSPRIVFDGDVDGVLTGGLLDDAEAVVREGLANAVRHADATTVVVSVSVSVSVADADGDGDGDGRKVSGRTGAGQTVADRTTPGRIVTVRIVDDGRGPGTQPPARASGTANLAARAAAHGGSSALAPGDDGGSILTWTVPITATPDPEVSPR